MPRRKPTRRSTNSRGAIQREKQDHSPAELSEELLAQMRDWQPALVIRQDDITVIVIDVV
jgi:hypothetical protein